MKIVLLYLLVCNSNNLLNNEVEDSIDMNTLNDKSMSISLVLSREQKKEAFGSSRMLSFDFFC